MKNKEQKEDIRAVIRRLSQHQYINVSKVLEKLDREMDTCSHFLKHKETDYSRGRYELLDDLRKWLIYTCRDGKELND